jgi:LuxR family quorum sensing-dependent transcriptional regulator
LIAVARGGTFAPTTVHEQGGYGGDALSFVDGLNGLSSPAAVVESLRCATAKLGFEYYCLSGFARPGERPDSVILAYRAPKEWLAVYAQERYSDIDHVLRFCRRSTMPFFGAAAPYDPEREPRAVEMLRRLGEFGIPQGLMVPIPGPAGCMGFVWLSGGRLELPEHYMPALHLMALYAFDRARCLLASTAEERTPLTARELEVLKWAACGKSAWEIGEILNISKRTADEHAQTGMRKLGAANRTQAVAIALRERLIEL